MIVINPYEADSNCDVCPICHININEYPNYTLTECDHTYHTDCIIQWFRTGHTNCPYCNCSYNNEDTENNTNMKYSYNVRRKSINDNYKIVKAYSKKKDVPKILKTKIKSIEKMEQQLKEIKTICKSIRNEEGPYKVIQKKYREYTNKKWRKTDTIYRKKRDLVDMVNIVPIIIPKKRKHKKNKKII